MGGSPLRVRQDLVLKTIRRISIETKAMILKKVEWNESRGIEGTLTSGKIKREEMFSPYLKLCFYIWKSVPVSSFDLISN